MKTMCIVDVVNSEPRFIIQQILEEPELDASKPSLYLPTELWLHILKYLYRCDLESLMGVNRQLMDVVLDARFQRAIAASNDMRRVSCFNDTSYIHFHAGAPCVLHRVKELIFKDDVPKPGSPPRPILQQLFSWFTQPDHPDEVANQSFCISIMP
ncbi:hypothetical protein BJ165DRAFT_1134752 [Panaeolus papilionaceus]|nr:hypothetical protein BJ165DRAFT_1134752 [Panaeolus papilionaceus]